MRLDHLLSRETPFLLGPVVVWVGVCFYGMLGASAHCQVLGFCARAALVAVSFVGWLWGVGVVVDFRIVDASILAHASFVGVWVVLFFVL